MKRLSMLFLLLAPTLLHAQPEFILSPGIRIGHASGAQGGMTFGIDLSLVANVGNRTTAGITFQSDHSRSGGWSRYHIGAQASYLPGDFPYSYGMEIGPSWITDERGTHSGLATNAFAGALIYPSLGATFYDGKVMAESGLYIKLPLPLYDIDWH